MPVVSEQQRRKTIADAHGHHDQFDEVEVTQSFLILREKIERIEREFNRNVFSEPALQDCVTIYATTGNPTGQFLGVYESVLLYLKDAGIRDLIQEYRELMAKSFVSCVDQLNEKRPRLFTNTALDMCKKYGGGQVENAQCGIELATWEMFPINPAGISYEGLKRNLGNHRLNKDQLCTVCLQTRQQLVLQRKGLCPKA